MDGRRHRRTFIVTSEPRQQQLLQAHRAITELTFVKRIGPYNKGRSVEVTFSANNRPIEERITEIKEAAKRLGVTLEEEQ